jgi:hypothetical protein
MKNTFKILLSGLASAILMSSCEKVIDVDLNEKDPKIVIEGKINDEPGPYYVRLSSTVNFDETNTFPGLDNALVIVTDNFSLQDTLTSVGNGYYRTTNLSGTTGHTYSLYVRMTDGKEFTASSRMPEKVALDTVVVDSLEFFGQKAVIFTPVYSDPVPEGNRYRFILTHNVELLDDIILFDDRWNNGLTNTRPIFADAEFESGDSVFIEMQDIDMGVFDYFNSLALMNDGQSASPANPLSNIQGGALGYFSAHTVQRRTVIIP